MESISYKVLIWSTGRVAHLRNVIFYEESITNRAMSDGAHPFIDPYQLCEASVDKMLDPRLKLLKGTDDANNSNDEETSDWTVGPKPVKFEESDDMEDVPIRPRHTVQPINRLIYLQSSWRRTKGAI